MLKNTWLLVFVVLVVSCDNSTAQVGKDLVAETPEAPAPAFAKEQPAGDDDDDDDDDAPPPPTQPFVRLANLGFTTFPTADDLSIRLCAYHDAEKSGPWPPLTADSVEYKEVTTYTGDLLKVGTAYKIRALYGDVLTEGCPDEADIGEFDVASEVEISATQIKAGAFYTFAALGKLSKQARLLEDAVHDSQKTKIRAFHAAFGFNKAEPAMRLCYRSASGQKEVLSESLNYSETSPYVERGALEANAQLVAVPGNETCQSAPFAQSVPLAGTPLGESVTAIILGQFGGIFDEEVVLIKDSIQPTE